jgi:peptidoglycan hydrolase-like protein with peptidoglycan-binding domain
MDLAEVSVLYRQALEAKDEVVRSTLAQAVAEAGAARLALEATHAEVIGSSGVTQGAAVRRLQLQLAERGANVRVDGEFGPETEAAVTEFQRAAGLKADGVAGPHTLARLGGVGHDEVGAALATKAHAELASFAEFSSRAVSAGDLASAEPLAAEAAAAESLAAEAIAAEILSAEAAENQFSSEPIGAEAAIAEGAAAEGLAETSEALEAFVAESVQPRG